MTKAEKKTEPQDYVASVQLVANLCGESTEVLIGKPGDHEKYGVVLLNGLLKKFVHLQKLGKAAAKAHAYPCSGSADLKEIANRFAEEELGAGWSVGAVIPSCPQTGGGYRTRKPGDPPCESFPLQYMESPEPYVTLDCGGQVDPRPNRPGAPPRPPTAQQLTLAFAVNVRLAKKP